MTFDYIIVGAGSSGCVLANRLSADSAVSVLLLEAGGPDTKFELQIPAAYSKLNGTTVDWGFWTEPQTVLNNRRMYQPRGKTLGGCSSINAMAYVRGNRLDYDDWAGLGNAGWGYDDVLPYFKRSEHNEQFEQFDARYHGTDGLLNVTFAQYRTALADAFLDACQQTGICRNHDYNGAEQDGAGFLQFTIKNGKRHSAATAFLKPVMHRLNLTVITRAYTKQVLLTNDRATGVEFMTGKNTVQTATARREVILSAGSFQSPQLLMLSGIGPADALHRAGIALKKELPGVGQNLQDHLFTGVSSLSSQRGVSSNFHLKPFNQLKGLGSWLLNKTGPMTASPLEAVAFIKTEPEQDRPNLQFHFAPVHMGDNYQADMYDLTTWPTTDGYIVLPTLLKPKSRGYVTLRSANPIEAPLIQPNYLTHEEDRRVLIRGVRQALAIKQADAFGPFRERIQTPADSSSDDTIWQHILQQLETVYHPVGTCKMGTDEMAVVDADLRVRGIDGLRVIDASVMPTIVSGNTNAPTIMIGERGADLVLGRVANRQAGAISPPNS